jgi:hypothetical protein
MTRDARGTAATPLDVSIRVNIIPSCWPKVMWKPEVVPAACATKTEAMAR